MSLSCDMSPLSYSDWWPEWLCECRVSLLCDMSPLSLLQLLVAGVVV